MKKLLLVAALLTLGVTAYSLTYTDNYPEFNNAKVAGELVGNGKWRDITDAKRNPDQINRFIKKGRGWTDKDYMLVVLTVHKPIKIEAETNFLYGEGVLGDKLEFGDVEFIVSGTKDAKANFTFYGPVFDMMKAVTIEYQGNVDVKTGDGLKGTTIATTKAIDLEPNGGPHTGPDEVSIEMDMYFKLEKAGHPYGLVKAFAYYE